MSLTESSIDGKCTIATGSEYELVPSTNLKKLLGYEYTGAHAINTVIKSENKVNIKVHCNIVDGNSNINAKGGEITP